MTIFNDLVKDDDKKIIEPFNLVGRRAQIFSKEEAAKILKDNSYYIFVAAAMLLVISIFIGQVDVGISQAYLLVVGLFYCALGLCIRKFKSRVASLLALTSFGYVFVTRILEHDTGGLFFFTFIFLAASYRAVRASFFYHKAMSSKEKTVV